MGCNPEQTKEKQLLSFLLLLRKGRVTHNIKYVKCQNHKNSTMPAKQSKEVKKSKSSFISSSHKNS